MITRLMTYSHWKKSTLDDLKRDLVGVLVNSRETIPRPMLNTDLDRAMRAGPSEFTKYYDVIVKGIKSDRCKRGKWTTLDRSRMIRTPHRLVVVEWEAKNKKPVPQYLGRKF